MEDATEKRKECDEKKGGKRNKMMKERALRNKND